MIDVRPLSALTLATCALAACGGSPSTSPTPSSAGASTPATSASPTQTPTASGPTTVSTGTTALGTVLTTPQGLTLYYFTPEKGGVVACTAGCASTWPPLKASGAASEPSGVTGALGTVALADGSMEVTYNGWPLHTYAADTAAGQTNGQGIAGKWFAATPSLTTNGAAPAAATSTPYNPY
ncbi:MAG: hypothetical protein JOZ75_03340 [Candidatus Dormibacteraeota bacterium]|nr:hypothetical protein [Candidatus Dormibacteraeota bacterium]